MKRLEEAGPIVYHEVGNGTAKMLYPLAIQASDDDLFGAGGAEVPHWVHKKVGEP